MLTLLALLVFWDTERAARLLGEQYAADIAGYPQQFAAITVYSEQDLKIDAAGVREEIRGAGGDAYSFRYPGLRLMERTAGQYVLISEIWKDGQGRMIILKDNDKIRVQFTYPYR